MPQCGEEKRSEIMLYNARELLGAKSSFQGQSFQVGALLAIQT
jgi:hypothetical protein